MTKRFAFLIFLCVLALLGTAQAATRYVHNICPNNTAAYNPLGNGGAGSCTGGDNTPSYNTINSGIAALNPGDSLYIRAGTYAQSLNWPTGGTALLPILIAAYPGATVIVRPPNGSGLWTSGGTASNQYVTVDGLIVDGTSQTASGQVRGVAICCHYDAHFTFKNGEIRNWTSHGIEGFAERLTFTNNLIHDNGRSTDGVGYYAAYIACRGTASTPCIWENNTIYNHPYYGLHIFDSGQTNVSYNIVRNNIFHHNGTSTSGGPGGFALLLSSGSNNTAYSNIFYSNGVTGITGGGLQVAQNCSNCSVYNNTFYQNGNFGIQVDSGVSATQLINNIIWNNASGSISNSGTGTAQSFNLCNSGCTGAGAKNGQDPRFISSTDFRLQSNSPAINAGSNTVCPATDINGLARPVGGTCDMGAYEFGGTASSPSVLITSPSATGSYSAITTPITTIAGSATSGVALTSVTWSNDRGGSGTATGTTTWSIASLTLQTGVNVITVTVTDVNGLTGQATIGITYGEAALVGAWSCDESSGSSVADASGNGNSGTFTAPGWTAGKFGSACVFDAPNAVVTVADSASLDVTGSLTLSAWVYPTLQTDAWRALFAKEGSYWLFASSSAQCGASAPYGGFYTGSYQSTCYGTLLPLNTWTFVAMRFDGAQLQLLTGTTPETLTVRSTLDVSAPIVPNASSLSIGNTGSTEPFIGWLDNLRVFNYGRSIAANSGICGSNYSQLQCDMITAINPSAPVVLNLGTGTVSLQLGPGVTLELGAQ
jgi:parallel beta-helix repeat protein